MPLAALCWAVSVFVLVQVFLLVGDEAVALQLEGDLAVRITPPGVVAGVAVGLALAAASVVLVLRVRPGALWGPVVAGGALAAIAVVTGAMLVQQWSVGAAIARAAGAPGATTAAQGVLLVVVVVLVLAAVATPLLGGRRQR